MKYEHNEIKPYIFCRFISTTKKNCKVTVVLEVNHALDSRA